MRREGGCGYEVRREGRCGYEVRISVINTMATIMQLGPILSSCWQQGLRGHCVKD